MDPGSARPHGPGSTNLREHRLSELTQCNYCTLKDITLRAADRGATVTVSPDPDPRMGGMLAVQASDRDKPSAWFMALSDHCVC